MLKHGHPSVDGEGGLDPLLECEGAPLPLCATDARPRRVLVVDDNLDIAFGLRLLLHQWSCEVEIALDGLEALEAVRRFRPDVVLLDLGLPRLDGLEVARRLRRDPALARLRLVALTGYGDDEDRARARAAGFDHHLVKPLELDDLRIVLRVPCG